MLTYSIVILVILVVIYVIYKFLYFSPSLRSIFSRSRVVVSLTTSPKRISKIKPTIDSILSQSVLPDKIYLNLPHVFKRNGSTFELPLPDFITSNPLIHVNFCEDIGPATKVLPTVQLEPLSDRTYIISVDDDHHYPSNLIENYLFYSTVFPDTVITGQSFMPDKDTTYSQKVLLQKKVRFWNLPPTLSYVELVEGFSAVMYRRDFLEDFDYSLLNEKSCYLGDDFILSNHLRSKNLKIISLGNQNLATEIYPFSYGFQPDALHQGADGLAVNNLDNYKKCSDSLKLEGKLHMKYYA